MLYDVECLNLTKKFGKTLALDNVNLTIEKNKIYGLLGRNGAGKTTLLNILATQSFQTKGTIKIFDEEPYENAKVLSEICFIKEGGSYLSQLKVKEILNIASNFYVNWNNDFAIDLTQQFNLPSNKKYFQLSKGMQSVLGIVIGLASRAPVTIYDEPYLGLDAASRGLFYQILLRDYSENPRTIILSTHLIDEVSKIFENIIILDKGKVILEEEADSIRAKAMYLSGRKDRVEEVTRNKNVINFQQVGNMASAAIYELLTQDQQKRILSEDIEIKPIPMQKFFIYITASIEKRGDGFEQN